MTHPRLEQSDVPEEEIRKLESKDDDSGDKQAEIDERHDPPRGGGRLAGPSGDDVLRAERQPPESPLDRVGAPREEQQVLAVGDP